eukprot:21580-Hanusia_phi.AAC.4
MAEGQQVIRDLYQAAALSSLPEGQDEGSAAARSLACPPHVDSQRLGGATRAHQRGQRVRRGRGGGDDERGGGGLAAERSRHRSLPARPPAMCFPPPRPGFVHPKEDTPCPSSGSEVPAACGRGAVDAWASSPSGVRAAALEAAVQQRETREVLLATYVQDPSSGTDLAHHQGQARVCLRGICVCLMAQEQQVLRGQPMLLVRLLPADESLPRQQRQQQLPVALNQPHVLLQRARHGGPEGLLGHLR